MQILQQVGELLLSAVPTLVLFLLLLAAYNALLHKPLLRVLGERHARTHGAVEKARADVAAADARTAEYEQRLREARMEIYKAQEARRHRVLDSRASAVAEARAAAERKVKEARENLERDTQAARAALQAEGDRLAQDVISAVLRPATAGSAR